MEIYLSQFTVIKFNPNQINPQLSYLHYLNSPKI
jgi:hypothetical protein